MVRVIVIRHGEREDHINTEWQNTAHRPHDSPLSLEGVSQAKACGQRLGEALGGLVGKKLVTLVSPLQRCVVTAKLVLGEMGVEEGYSMCIEEAFAEGNSYLRNRMFGKSATSNKKNMLTGKPRSITTPVLLGPGDLTSIAFPIRIDTGHVMLHKVSYSKQGFEQLDTPVKKTSSSKFSIFRTNSQSQSNQLLPPLKRLNMVIPRFKAFIDRLEESKESEEELVLLVVTHGAIGKTFTSALTRSDEDIGFNYCTTVQIEKKNDSFKVVDVWNVPGLQPREIHFA